MPVYVCFNNRDVLEAYIRAQRWMYLGDVDDLIIVMKLKDAARVRVPRCI